jgi:hypothetical protein
MGKEPKNTSVKDAKRTKVLSDEDKLDDALDDSFPASDPPSQTDPLKHLGSGKKTSVSRSVPKSQKPL